MKILVLNCGTSSLKYQLMDMDNEEIIAKGNYERIGIGESFVTHKVNEKEYEFINPITNHMEAIEFVIQKLTDSQIGVIKSLDDITAIGHRTVHGGEKFKGSVIIDDEVIKAIEECSVLAPLHNPAALLGINACKTIMPKTKMVAVFDTAFHQTMDKEKYIYPIPYRYYRDYGIRKYGFHGTSHKYVSQRISEILNRNDLKIINCHIGQGASLCAIKDGKSVDTTMGLTPLAGIPMGTRSGDLDPSVVTYIMEKEKLTPEQMDKILNKESGILGMSEISADNRDIYEAVDKGNEQAELCLKIYRYIIAQYIAKFAVALNGVDVITFCAGVGERGVVDREHICEHLKFMGVELDSEANNIRAVEREISTKNSKVKVWIVPTNEELMIAREVKNLL